MVEYENKICMRYDCNINENCCWNKKQLIKKENIDEYVNHELHIYCVILCVLTYTAINRTHKTQ